VVDKVALGLVFSEYFGFSFQFSFHQMLYTHLASGAGTIGQLVADVRSGLSLTPPQETKEKTTVKLRIFPNATVSNTILSTCRSQRPAETAVLQRKANQE
jgi:hypothetical protein